MYWDVTIVYGLPSDPDYRLIYLPSPTTLFRFSALTFNAHAIHLDREYARSEGYSGGFRHIQEPRTALTLGTRATSARAAECTDAP